MKKYSPEFLFLVTVMLLSITGFWKLYFGDGSEPNAHHHLHVITTFAWLTLLLIQLSLIGSRKFYIHRNVGFSVLLLGPLVVATVAMLSVHSASRALTSSQPDILIVSNVMITIELGMLILMAFILKKQRRLHGAFLLSSALLFMGIALFFTLISFIPQFKIEGPETFHRFSTAATTARYICAIVGLAFFLRNVRDGWPWLLVTSFFFINGFVNTLIVNSGKINKLTEFIGSLDQRVAFIGSFAGVLILLISTGGWNFQKRESGKINVY